MKPLVSVIIPCYNHGNYLPDALESVAAICKNGLAEVIVINDGSTDIKTLSVLNQIRPITKVIDQTNQGLAAARNRGIAEAVGKYIAPLDSDNQFCQGFVEQAVQKLEHDAKVDIVYSDSEFFGEENRYNHVGLFSPTKLINDNYIDACSIFRKQVWTDLSGYDGKMPAMGHEDWDFWIRAMMAKKFFYYLEMVGFRYRVRGNSMLQTVTRPKLEENREYIYAKHHSLLFHSIHRTYSSDMYKGKYLDLLTYLKNQRIKSIIKVIFGLRFNQ